MIGWVPITQGCNPYLICGSNAYFLRRDIFTLERDIWGQIGRGKSGQAGGNALWVPTGPQGSLEDRPSGPVANPGLPLGFHCTKRDL